MGKLNSEGMTAIDMEKAKRKEALRTLTSEPFDDTNQKHLDALTQYNDLFEYRSNQMYLFQGMNEGLKVFAGSWLLGRVLPIPDFLTYMLSFSLYLGAAGYVLEKFSMAEFHDELNEMKQLYNWCFKGGKKNYASNIDNTDKLGQPELQRLVKSIAPLCSIDFMLAWPRETAREEEVKSGWGNVLSLGVAAASSTWGLFANSKSSGNSNQIRELKKSVETGELKVGVFKGCEQAIRYFATSFDYKFMLRTKLNETQEALSTYLSATAQNSMKKAM